MTTIGLIGAGHIGSQVARLAVAHDYDVVISNSRGPETLSELVAELGPRARAATAAEAATAGDIVVVTVPLKNYRSVPVEPLRGKVVIDTNNYYPQRDGHIPELDNESTTTAELLQAHLPTSKVVKAFNHIYAAELTTHGQPPGTKNRRALVIAGDDREAKATVTRLLDQFGFDTVDAGPLKEGWRIQRDTPGYGPRRTAEELRKDLAAAKRYSEQGSSGHSRLQHLRLTADALMCEFAQTTDRRMREAFLVGLAPSTRFVRVAKRWRKQSKEHDKPRLYEGCRAGSPHRRSVAGASEVAADRRTPPPFLRVAVGPRARGDPCRPGLDPEGQNDPRGPPDLPG